MQADTSRHMGNRLRIWGHTAPYGPLLRPSSGVARRKAVWRGCDGWGGSWQVRYNAPSMQLKRATGATP